MRFKTFQNVIMKGSATFKVLRATETTIEFSILNFNCLKTFTHKSRIMLSSLVNFKIPSCKRLKIAAWKVAMKHFYFLIGFRVPRCNVSFQGQLMKKCISAMFAYMRTVTRVLFLQVIVKRRRVAMLMSRSGIGSEITKMTHKISICISLITDKFLLFCYIFIGIAGSSKSTINHSGVTVWQGAIYSIFAIPPLHLKS